MAGKITDLGVLTGAAAATTDLIETVDVSDTSMAATGTNKKMTLSDMATFVAAQGGAATGTKLTDLTAITGGTLTGTDILEVVDISDTTMHATGTNKKITVQEFAIGLAPWFTALDVGAGVVSTTAIADANVTNAKLANMVQATIKGRAAGAGTGVPTDLTAAQVSTLLGLGTLATKSTIASADITDGVVSNADLTTMATLTIKGNSTAATAAPQDLTAAAVRSMVASGAGALFGFDFDTITTAGPSATRLRLNNATPASATIVYIAYTSKDGADLKTRLLAGTAGDRLYIQERANSANWRLYELTGAPTDNTTYATINVVHRGGAGSLWANLAEIIAGFMTAAITISTSAPASPTVNDLWVDTT
jgi:hypothetical protein